MGALTIIFSFLVTPILPKEYAFGNFSWVKLEQRNIAIKPAKQGLMLEPEKWWHRVIFLFTKEGEILEGIIKTHLIVRYR